MADLNQTQQAFVDRYAPYANLASMQTGLPSRVILAKIALETGYGTRFANNNLPGLMSGSAAQNQGSLGSKSTATWEDRGDGSTYNTNANFLTYRTPEESIGGLVNWLSGSGRFPLNSLADRPGGGVFDSNPSAEASAVAALGKSGFSTDTKASAGINTILGKLPDLGSYGVASSFDPSLNRLAQVAPYQAGGADVSLGAGDITSNNYWSRGGWNDSKNNSAYTTQYQGSGQVLPREVNASGLSLPSPEMGGPPAQLSALDKISDGLTGGLRAGANLIGNRFVEATGRLPTAEEFGARVDALKSGASDVLSQLTEIASSPEAKTFAQSTGLDPSQYVVNDIYRSQLGRDVDRGSLGSQMEVLRTQGAGGLLNQINNSQEGQTYALNNFIGNAFGREADQGGLSYWASQLAAGRPLSAVETDILSSPEALNLGYTPEQIPQLIGDYNLPFQPGVNVPSPIFQPSPLQGGNYNLPPLDPVNPGNPFQAPDLVKGDYNLPTLDPVNPGNPFQQPDLTPGNYNLDPLNPVDVKNPLFQPDPLTGGNFNLPGVPLPSTPIQPVGPDGFTTSPIGPGAETSPVGPGGLSGTVPSGPTTSPVGFNGSEISPVAPTVSQTVQPTTQSPVNTPTETQPVGPDAFGANPVQPNLSQTVAPPGLSSPVAAPAAVPAFDADAYRAANPDVAAFGMDPLQHFLKYGYNEGRSIDAAGDKLPQGFNATAYLAANPDVTSAGMNPLEHFARFGASEGRSLAPTGFTNANVSSNVGDGTFRGTFNGADYLAANRDVASSGMDPLQHFLRFGAAEGRAIDTAGDHLPQNFDGNAYLAQNQDVARLGMNPLEHYLRFGAAEGRAAPTGSNPTSFTNINASQGLGPTGDGTFHGTFNAADYLAQNKDVAASGMDPLSHYLQFGFNEGRAIDTRGDIINKGFDPLQYLNLNQDVKAAGMDPLRHFLTAGASEGRALPTGSNPYSFTNFNVAQGAGPTGNGSFGLSGIGSTASAAPQASNPINPFGFSQMNAGTYAAPTAPLDMPSGGLEASWESASKGALPGSGGASGSAWEYKDSNGQTQVATFDPQKSENAYLAGQVAQNQQQIEAGQSPFATNPNLVNASFLATPNAGMFTGGPSATANAQFGLINPINPLPAILAPPVIRQGLGVNPYGGFGLISTF